MPIFDDELLSELEPTGTARYTLTDVRIPRTADHPVVLIVKPAGRLNKPYTNGLAKIRGSDRDANDLALARLLARHVIAGWENVAKDGKPLAYSADAGEELLATLLKRNRHDLFGMIAGFASDLDNFRSPGVDAGDLGNG